MGADPITMCGNCREVIAYFPLSSCVGCINELYGIDINEKPDRVITKDNKISVDWSPHCLDDEKCESLHYLDKCLDKGHRVLIDPCW